MAACLLMLCWDPKLSIKWRSSIGNCCILHFNKNWIGNNSTLQHAKLLDRKLKGIKCACLVFYTKRYVCCCLLVASRLITLNNTLIGNLVQVPNILSIEYLKWYWQSDILCYVTMKFLVGYTSALFKLSIFSAVRKRMIDIKKIRV